MSHQQAHSLQDYMYVVSLEILIPEVFEVVIIERQKLNKSETLYLQPFINPVQYGLF